ncbi:WD40/YVTN repeat-like-containing domain protein [Cordyceps fumosorosea ARSEF 2679]|uniref:WD40/YVTN repeat-like-containing domain protein n=1 Tax=Cordyceps fumosorosea (strain ARSEF 2679) TaxID=1081104 RepID=A0A168AQB4_CORFA|nr:WD40/YVTN repeat-like-containing domain protein [Cordyceps fumosorosea ARSEF 2679]OAA69046.1 WD40/YVTN repeat-like-containing domain protein [Cordyceps fumosorosea ARSEF 2679]
MTASTDDSAFHLPKLRVSFGFEARLTDDTRFLNNDDDVAGIVTLLAHWVKLLANSSLAEFFDVKFCPYQPLNCDPVFAAVLICKLSSDSGDANPCSVLSIIRDDDEDASGCCCTWTKDPITGAPFICIGGGDAKVKIYDVRNGTLVDSFSGHGGDVNDLATSPVDSSIIASASNDTSIRIWSVEERFRSNPCLCILAGEGHYGNLLSLSFHHTGRYLLSGGHDQIINLWTVPDLPTKPVITPFQVHYPHFSTSAVHSGIVDCVAFFGDEILSRACHDNVIVLWRIVGFAPDDPLPPQTDAPTVQAAVLAGPDDQSRLTRSFFQPTLTPESPVQYVRLLELHTPNCGPQFFMRFGLHHVPGQNPVLAFCNAGGNILFWDLHRLVAYREVMSALRDRERTAQPPVLPSWLKPIIPRQRADMYGRIKGVKEKRAGAAGAASVSTTSSSRGGHGEPGPASGAAKATPGLSAETLESWAAKYSTEDPHEPISAHRTESSASTFVGRQAAWSPGGEWCVVVGSSNTALVLQRWAK